MPFLTKVTTNAIVSALRKKETKASRSGKMLLPDELTGDASLQSKPNNLFDIRSLLRDDAFRKALDECTADDEELKEYVVAIETFEDIIPAAQGHLVAAGRSGDQYLRTQEKVSSATGEAWLHRIAPQEQGMKKKERGESPHGIVRGESRIAVWTGIGPHR